MRIPGILVLAFALSALCAGCDTREDTTDGPLPNSLADTTTRAAPHEIPRYGPPSHVDSVRTQLARGQVLYVPVYSHIFHRTEDRTFDLATTLSIRNTSPTTRLLIHAVDYFDSEGRVLKSYVDHPRALGPLASTFVVIDEADRSGGVGANFIVTWQADQRISPPLIEAVMISTQGGQGISFTSAARVLEEW